MAISNSLFSELARNSILLISLHGVRTVLERELEIKNIMIATNDAIKRELMRKDETQYPYSYLNMSELIGIRDQQSNKVMQRFGIRAGMNGATRATSRKAFMFPINVGMELKYIDSDPLRIITMAESLVLLSIIGGLQFEIGLSDGIRFLVRVEIPESTSIPISSGESTESPGGSEITLSLIIHTYAGFFRDVSAVNSSSPTIDMQIILNGDTTVVQI
jgi:hypothetical protein